MAIQLMNQAAVEAGAPENVIQGMTGTSVVTAGYGTTHGTLARLGVVGPTHMDYPSTMASVRAVARYLGRLLRNE